jgi:hypothetical protein
MHRILISVGGVAATVLASVASGQQSAGPVGDACRPPSTVVASTATDSTNSRGTVPSGGATRSQRGERICVIDIEAMLEQSYLTFASKGRSDSRDKMWFEGNVAPHFTLTPFGTVGVVVTPKVVLRMFSTESRPVRTPSYMPRMTIYVPLKLAPGEAVNDYLVATFSHHSNGQNGAFLDSTGNINLTDGSFSTNFLTLGYQGVKRAGRSQRLLGLSFSAEYHFRGLMADEIVNIYPRRRSHLGGRFVFRNTFGIPKRVLGEDVELTGRMTFYNDGLVPRAKKLPKRLGLQGTLAVHPNWLDQLSLFVNAFSGPDYYNLRFTSRLNVVRIGLATANPTRHVVENAPTAPPPGH